ANWRYGSIVSGIPGHPIEDVQISNIRFVQQGGGGATEAALEPEEKENAYPEPNMFGTMPASAFFIRHARNIEMHHATLSFEKEEARPAFVLNDVAGADFDHIKVKRPSGALFFS